ncbi:MAG: hypothetical protein IJE18_07145 [Bacteroidaceae bacterium]|nr:hypothetical protein [Bacteroidaceae bacterium]
MNTQEIIAENALRLSRVNAPYDPYTGTEGVVPRTPIECEGIGTILCPTDLLNNYPEYKKGVSASQLQQFTYIRFRYDFEYFCAYCARVQDKETADIYPFILRYAQRKLLKVLEDQRRANQPIRVILLKARQWGGSTCTQIYMAWIQLFHRINWHSVICAHLKDAALNIKGMYTTMMQYFPEWIYGPLKMQPYEKTQNISYIKQIGCKITIGSAEAPDSVRSQNVMMAHISEAGVYPTTAKNNPTRLIRSVAGSILRIPYSIVVVESTANGTGNWFHTEWLKAERGKSDKYPLFVAWFEIEMYSSPLPMPEEEFIATLSDYEWQLWELGATLQAINWYRHKRMEYHNDDEMQAEFPSTAVEAFTHSGEIIFKQDLCEKLRKLCREPEWRGDIYSQTKFSVSAKALTQLALEQQHNGLFQIWAMPDTSTQVARRYIVSVDVGGRSAKADYSVITVLDRYWLIEGGVPEVVAEWRGHIDHDLLAWKAAQIATLYNNALLVIESNTLESKDNPDALTDDFILDQIASTYDNLYARQDPQRIREGLPPRWGFHTNRKTKQTLVDNMIAIVRTQGYIERNDLAINEMLTYERLQNGGYGATSGNHDDILMTRMIALYVSSDIEPPAIIDSHARIPRSRTIITEATI